MPKQSASPLVIFVHIPRAGGTSAWRALRKIYRDRLRRVTGLGTEGTYEKLREILLTASYDYDLVGGHVPYGMHRFTTRPCSYITVLRDPTDIILSLYFRRHQPEIWMRKRLRKTGQAAPNRLPPLPDRPIVETVRKLRGNPMIRLLCGVDDDWGRPQGRCTRDHLEHAKHNLQEHFSAIAFVESYQESMQAMAGALGWKSVPTVEKRNSGRSRPARYPAEVYEAGREVNALDYELYDFARSLERERLRRNKLARSAPSMG
ncbi:MAG: hypothetical protein OEM59_08440 [Rhodospirillales bacterium]|nr:hypothetical protein [Rhodospirillales bacterium]